MIDDSVSQNQSGVLETPGKSTAHDLGIEAIRAATERPKRAYRKRGQNAAPVDGISALKSASAEMSPELQATIAQQLEYCYDPKAWGALLALPAHVALAKTGHKHWNISEGETQTLGACGSVGARFLMISSPAALAALMVASALFAVYVPRTLEELKLRQQEKKTEEKK